MEVARVFQEKLRRPTNDELRALVDEHGAAMYRVAVSIVRDPAMAEDVVQDAIVKVWDALPTFRGEAPLRAWILRITHNTAVSALRKVRDEAWDPATLPDTGHLGGVESTAEAHEDMRRLAAAVADLDELSRSILAMRTVEGMAYEEIAAALGVTLGQVKIRLFRARRALAERVRGEIDE